jgi:DNA polymerase-3 subunit delta'
MWPIIGHDWAVELLQTAVLHQHIGHAYLFTGPAQVGKTTLARLFAQALNCQSEALGQRPCGVCRACKLIAADKHPDVRVVAPELNSRGKPVLKIEQMRELQKELNLGTFEARYKIAILADFDAANPNAANAFLKTLEEPPPNVILLLTATETDALLPTINSRCRTFQLRPLPAVQVAEALRSNWQVPPDLAFQLAHLSNGRLGWAVQAAQDASVLHARQEQLGWLEQALNGRRYQRFDLADKLAKQPEALDGILQTWLSWWRDVMLLAHGRAADIALINADQQAQLQLRADGWTAEQIQTSLTQTKTALWQLERNANVRLVLENLFLVYPHGR